MKTMKFKRVMLLATLLVMTLSAVTGGTIAWFTDSVTSNTNVIKSGNLDVELEYWNGTGFSKVNENTVLFNEDALWEPGYAEVAYLKVSNEGNLVLKYQLGVNVTNETEGKTKDGASIMLADHLVFKAVEITEEQVGQYTRASAMDAAGTEKGFKSYNGATKVLDVKGTDNDEDYVALIVYMPTTVGNEANHNGTDIPSISFGVSLEATQKDSEDDSFGPDYDEDAWMSSFKVSTASELSAAIAAIEDGDVIEVLADLTFDENSRTHNSGTWYDGLFYEGDKSFTIDLNGNTISNDSSVNDYLLNFLNKGSKPNTITIKNGTLNAASSAYCALCTSTSSTQQITINLEDVNVIGNNSNGSVVKIRGGAVLNVKDGTVITGQNSYLAIENWKATVNIYDGAEIYQNGNGSYNGCLVGVGGNGTVNVYGGKGKSVRGGFIAMTSGGTINIHGGEWIANNDGSIGNNSNLYVLTAQNNKNESGYAGASIINVTGGTFRGGMDAWVLTNAAVEKAEINISGGSFNANPTSFVEDGFKTVENNGVYSVVFDGAMVATAADLTAALASGEDILLTADIDYTAGILIPEGVKFDGNGKTITYASNEYAYHLVKLSTGVELKNVTLDGYRARTEDVTNGTVTLENVTIYVHNNDTGLDISRGTGTAKLTNVKCANITDAAHLDPNTDIQVGYAPYGDVLLGTKWGLEATDCEFGSLHGWNTTNGSNVYLNNTTYTVFRMHYWNNRTLYVDGVQTAWAASGAIPVVHDVGGCWSVQPAFR